MNFKIIFIFLILCISLVSCAQTNQVLIRNEKTQLAVTVEIADDASERARGLMFREKLDEGMGMLFVFEREGAHSFWMKNTLIPLDMIFIDKNKRIIQIEHAQPCHSEPCHSYVPKMPVKYVLEVNGNYTTKHDILPGNNVELPNYKNI